MTLVGSEVVQMAETIKFEGFEQKGNPHCLACEAMLPDVQDEILSPADKAWFDQHVTTCSACSQMLADAQRGAAWLELLKNPRPEPSAALLERILAQSAANETPETSAEPAFAGAYVPLIPAVPVRTNLLPFRPRMPRLATIAQGFFEPRLAMTAAMAFFSIALTLNLTGVKLNQLSASDLKPSNLTKSYYEATAQTVRFYDNLRVVRVLESRVDDLRQSNDREEPLGQPEKSRPEPVQPSPAKPAPEKPSPEPRQPENKPTEGPGMSRRETPVARPQFLLTDDRTRHNHAVGPYNVQIVRKEGGLA
jgi:hypothetical protein